jgi:TRAP-type C4-dicarboxylate transport system substrate-binding protein
MNTYGRIKIMVLRSRFCLLGLFLGAALIIGPQSVLAKRQMVIKLATLAPEGSVWTQIINQLNEEIKAKTEQRVGLRIYAGGVMGDESDMLRKLQIGQIQGAFLSSSGLTTLVTDLDVVQIPFLFDSYQEVDFVMEKLAPVFKKGFEEKGYELLGWSEGGFVRLFTIQPVVTLEALRRSRVWAPSDSPMTSAIFDEAGVTAIPLSLPDVLVGLQTGMVDVVYAPPLGVISLQWHTKVKYMVDLPLIYVAGGVLVKKSFFERLSPTDQAVLRKLFPLYMKTLKQQVRQKNQEAITVMQQHGVQVLQVQPDQVAEFKALSRRAMTRRGDKSYSQTIADQVGGYLEAFRKGKP